MNPHASQYAPPDTAPDLSEAPRVAADPDLVMRFEDGYVVEMLPATGGLPVSDSWTVLLAALPLLVFALLVTYLVIRRRG